MFVYVLTKSIKHLLYARKQHGKILTADQEKIHGKIASQRNINFQKIIKSKLFVKVKNLYILSIHSTFNKLKIMVKTQYPIAMHAGR